MNSNEYKIFIQKNKEYINILKKESTMLINVIKNGNREFVNGLIKNGADINLKDIYGMTPIMHAIINGQIDIANDLIKHGVNINLTNNFGLTALIFAIKHYKKSHKDIDIVERLLSKDNINHQDKFGNTALMCAANRGHKDIIQILKDWGADITIKNKKGETATTITNKKI